MDKALRVVAGLGGAFYFYMALRWTFDPAGAAAGLNMSLMEGTDRNTQIGDLGAFFWGLGAFALYGVWKMKRDFLFAAAFLIATAATMRILAGLLHDAPTIWPFVVLEFISAAVWVAYGRTLKS